MGKSQHQTRKQRERKRAEHAATWADGFHEGYEAGYKQGEKDAKKTINIKLDQEQTKMLLDQQRKVVMDAVLFGRSLEESNLREFKKEWEKRIQHNPPKITVDDAD